MAFLSTGGTTFPDILIVVYLLVACAISTIINPVVYIYNARDAKSVPQLLFRLLSVIDFTTCIFMPIMVIKNVITPYDLECQIVGNVTVCPRPAYLEEHGNTTTTERVFGTISWTLLITPPIFTALLTSSRYLQIRHPLRPINLRYIIVFLIGYIVYVVGYLGYIFFRPHTRYYSRIQSVWNYFPGMQLLGTVLAFSGPCLLCQVIAIVASLLTVWELLKSLKDPRAIQLKKNGYKCSLKILLTNFGSILFMTFYIAMISIAYKLKERSKTDCILYFMYAVIVPISLSVFNPVIFVLFTPKTFKIAWNRTTHKGHINYSYSAKSRTVSLPVIHVKETSKLYQMRQTSLALYGPGVKRVSCERDRSESDVIYSNATGRRSATERFSVTGAVILPSVSETNTQQEPKVERVTVVGESGIKRRTAVGNGTDIIEQEVEKTESEQMGGSCGAVNDESQSRRQMDKMGNDESEA